jgi:hypothetical protein
MAPEWFAALGLSCTSAPDWLASVLKLKIMVSMGFFKRALFFSTSDFFSLIVPEFEAPLPLAATSCAGPVTAWLAG